MTAASKGLGRGSALALAGEGCNLVLNARGERRKGRIILKKAEAA